MWVHAFPEALVAEALGQAGHEIVYVGCGRTFEQHCICMTAARIAPDAAETAKDAICSHCVSRKNILVSEFGFRSFDISDVLDEHDFARAQGMLAGITPENFLDFRIEGVEVGRAALSTYLLTYKRSKLEFSARDWKIFLIELRNTVLSALACQKVFDREKPERVLLYSSGYSVNLVWCLLAEARDIPFYYMNAGSNLSDRLQKLVISRGHSLQRKLLDYWPAFREVPSTEKAAAYVTNHFIELLRGRHIFVYSSPKEKGGIDLRERFGIAEGQRVLVATMSSYDELFAAQATKLFPDDFDLIFPRQVDWLRALLGFMRNRSDLFLIVRVHPREFPNKRDSVKSDHASELERLLSDLPSNVCVNWPSDRVSLYDLAQIMDVCLNSWSTAGKEMGMLGIPVVLYSADLVFYPANLNYLGSSIDDYFRQINRALADGWSAERIREMYRWLALEDMYSRIDVSDSFRQMENPQRPLWQKVSDRVRRRINPDFRELADCRGRASVLNSAWQIRALIEGGHSSIVETIDVQRLPRISIEDETQILRRQVGRLVESMYGGIARASREQLGRNLLRFAQMS